MVSPLWRVELFLIFNMSIICIGLGLFAPIGEIGRVISSGNELVCSCEYATINRFSLANSVDYISFSDNDLSINTYHIAQKIKIRTFKKLYLTTGAGWYFIREELNNNIEKDRGASSFIGLSLPFYSGENQVLIYEMLYSTAPRGISLTLNFGLSRP